jgi:hypothetical protein
MKINNVNKKDTGMKPKVKNGKTIPAVAPHVKKRIVIGDLLFLIKLLQTYPDSFPTESIPVLYLPDVLAAGLSDNSFNQLHKWQQQERIIVLITGEDLFLKAIERSSNPGMQINDYIPLLTADMHKLAVATTSGLLTREANRLKVKVCDCSELLNPNMETLHFNEVKIIRVRKNKIVSYGVPAPIAGNN